MAKFWQIVQPTVWAPTTAELSGYDCEVLNWPDYGPHRTWTLDRTGHAPLGVEDFWAVPKKRGNNPLPYMRCECGWFGHYWNYQQEHLDVVLTKYDWVYS